MSKKRQWVDLTSTSSPYREAYRSESHAKLQRGLSDSHATLQRASFKMYVYVILIKHVYLSVKCTIFFQHLNVATHKCTYVRMWLQVTLAKFSKR